MSLKDKILRILRKEAILYDETEGSFVLFNDDFERVAKKIEEMVERSIKKKRGIMNKKIFIIHPVRNLSLEWKKGLEKYVEELERQGYIVHFPIRDTNQNDRTGLNICRENLRAIKEADEVHIAWDGKSQGCLFDLGMAFALNKPIKTITGYFPNPTLHKSFASMVHALEAEIWKY